jgi:aspartate ammonia-lyase
MRIESDPLGDVEVPISARRGPQTQRALDNFRLSGTPISAMPDLIKAMAWVKRAALRANLSGGGLDPDVAEAIDRACGEIIEGQWREEFVVDVYQGGAGTSTNMNVNEVIANRALELLGEPRGAYWIVSPNDHVNLSQSTNDAYATAVRLAVFSMNQRLVASLWRLSSAMGIKARAFAGIAKLGRTQLQDAVPMTLGEEFGAYAATIAEDAERAGEIGQLFLEVNIGGTAIGTRIGAGELYGAEVVSALREVSGLPVVAAANLIEATWDMGAFVLYSGMLKRIASKLSKIANDLRLLSSGPRGGFAEIILPQRQPGSSLMPGKVNPVMPEAINQIAFRVFGADTTITFAAEAGQLQLNAFEPVIVWSLHEATSLMSAGIQALIDNCILGIEANPAACEYNLARSMAGATELVSYVGYARATQIAQYALAEGLDLVSAAEHLDPALAAQWAADGAARKMSAI